MGVYQNQDGAVPPIPGTTFLPFGLGRPAGMLSRGAGNDTEQSTLGPMSVGPAARAKGQTHGENQHDGLRRQPAVA